MSILGSKLVYEKYFCSSVELSEDKLIVQYISLCRTLKIKISILYRCKLLSCFLFFCEQKQKWRHSKLYLSYSFIILWPLPLWKRRMATNQLIAASFSQYVKQQVERQKKLILQTPNRCLSIRHPNINLFHTETYENCLFTPSLSFSVNKTKQNHGRGARCW